MWVALAAEKLGLATSPPYLSLTSKANKNNASFIDGVSFASAGAGIFDGSDARYVSHQKKVVFFFFFYFLLLLIYFCMLKI